MSKLDSPTGKRDSHEIAFFGCQATLLVGTTSYNEAGQPSQVADPMGYVTQTSYDAAGRRTQTVEAYGSGSDRTTNYTYTLDNLIETLTAVNSTTGDQTTTYAYGTTLSDSGVARNDLLISVTYPDSVSASDVVSYTYNRLGQQATITDQRGTVRTFYYDALGRLTDDCVSAVGDDTDDAVLRISATYEVRGMVQTVTSYDNATPGSGTALNQCALSYNSFAQLIEEQQEHGGTANGSTPSVGYAYSSADPTSPNQIRLLNLIYPNGRVIAYGYGIAGQMDDLLNRVHSIQSDGSEITTYTYLGSNTVIRITYPQPSIWLDLWGGTSGSFAGLDQFNRVIDQRWQNNTTTTPTDIDRYQYGYDRNSNRTYKANVVGTPVVTGGLDEYYTYDPLNRLTDMQRGVLNGTKTGITGTPSVEQDWTLDPTGNWSGFLTKASGTTDLNQSRTSNKVNEITNISESTGPTWIVPAYDAAGNTTTMPQVADPTQSFTAVYDAWNRMVSISDSSGTVATYVYDGRNRRIVKVTTSTSETRHFYFTNDWQDVEERLEVSTSMDKQYVWGLRYVDELICRDDAIPQRLYACQDANFNLTSITDTSGNIAERYLFDPYGSRTIMNGSWSVIESSDYEWVTGHQGLLSDMETGLIYNRTRMLNPILGRFATWDPKFYIDGLNFYEYVSGSPINKTDWNGERSSWAHTICCAGWITLATGVCAAISCGCTGATFITIGGLAIPCTAAIIAGCGSSAGGAAVLCDQFCPD